MPVKLAQHLPDVPQETRDQLFGSITSIMTLPFDDPVRQGVIAGTFIPSRISAAALPDAMLTGLALQPTAK